MSRFVERLNKVNKIIPRENLFGLSGKKSNWSKLFGWMVVLTPVVAAMLCWWIGLQQSVWFDEAYSVWLAKQPVGELLSLTGVDTHPPIYYLLLKLWGALWGFDETSLRALSVALYSASIMCAGFFVRRWFGSKAAVYSLLLLMGAPLLMRYGFEIRMYGMASLIGMAATAALAQAWYTNLYRYWLVYMILVTLGMTTLYYTALLWLGQALWLFVMTWRRSKLKQWWHERFVWAYVGSVILFIPWLVVFLKQLGNNALAPIGQPMNLEQLLGIVSFNTLYKPAWQVGVIGSLAVVLLIVFIVWAWPRALRGVKYSAVLWLLLANVAVPVFVLIVISLIKGMYVERYLAHVALSLVILVGVVLCVVYAGRAGRLLRWRFVPLILLPVMILYGLQQLIWRGNYNFQRNEQPAINRVAAELHGCSDGSVVLAGDPYIAIELSYYLDSTSCEVYFLGAVEGQALRGGYAPLETSTYHKLYNSSQPFTQAPYIAVLYYKHTTARPHVPPGYDLVVVEGDSLVVMKFKRSKA